MSALGQVWTVKANNHYIKKTPSKTFVYAKLDTDDVDTQLSDIHKRLLRSELRYKDYVCPRLVGTT